MQQKRGKNKELVRLAEEKKKEVEKKKKEVEEKEIAAGRMRYEKERQTRFQKVRGPQNFIRKLNKQKYQYDPHLTVYLQVRREISPPIPTLQKRHRAPQSTSSPPSMDSRRSTSSMSVSYRLYKP